MAERDFRLMQADTATPLESGRVTALADRCEAEGLDNCATTLRGLLAEVARLTVALEWYAGRAAGCRLIHSEGDAARAALDADGGKRAREALGHG